MYCGTILATAGGPTGAVVGIVANRQANGNMLANNTVSQSSEVAFRAHVELIKPRRGSERASNTAAWPRLAKGRQDDVATYIFFLCLTATSGSR